MMAASLSVGFADASSAGFAGAGLTVTGAAGFCCALVLLLSGHAVSKRVLIAMRNDLVIILFLWC